MLRQEEGLAVDAVLVVDGFGEVFAVGGTAAFVITKHSCYHYMVVLESTGREAKSCIYLPSMTRWK